MNFYEFVCLTQLCTYVLFFYIKFFGPKISYLPQKKFHKKLFLIPNLFTNIFLTLNHFFAPTIFWIRFFLTIFIKDFFGQKIFLDQILFWPTFLFESQFISQLFFSNQNFSLDPKYYFVPKIFLDPYFIFDLNFVSTQNFIGPKTILNLTFVQTEFFFGPKYCFQTLDYFCPTIFWTRRFFWLHFFGTKILFWT